jgi:hypothetical protein
MLVIYLTAVTARVIQIVSYNRTGYIHLQSMLDLTHVAHLVLSLLINIFATSIIALKAWYVP